MLHESFTSQHRMLGRTAAFAVFFLLIAYVVTLVLGFLSLKSPQNQIGDPYFSILELLIIVIAPLMIIVMIAVHAYASSETKAYSLTALAFMIIMASITCTVHFVILTVSRQIESAGFPVRFTILFLQVAIRSLYNGHTRMGLFLCPLNALCSTCIQSRAA